MLQVMQNLTQTGSRARATMTVMRTRMPRQNPPQMMQGRGTYFDRGANRILPDPLDPRLASSEVHEALHADLLTNPPLNMTNLRQAGHAGLDFYMVYRLCEEAAAQAAAIEFQFECMSINPNIGMSPLRIYNINLVNPALMRDYVRAYNEGFDRFLQQTGRAQTPAMAQFIRITLDPTIPQDVALWAMAHPIARAFAALGVLGGIVRGEVVTSTTGHTYDYYYAMIWDQGPPTGNAAFTYVQQLRGLLGLPQPNRRDYSYGGLQTRVGNHIANATNSHQNYQQQLQLVIPGEAHVLRTMRIIGAKYTFDLDKRKVQKAYRQLMAAEAILGHRMGTMGNPLPQFLQPVRGSQWFIGAQVGPQGVALQQAQAAFEQSLFHVERTDSTGRVRAYRAAKMVARVKLALLWEVELQAGLNLTPMPQEICIRMHPGVITMQAPGRLLLTARRLLRRVNIAQNNLTQATQQGIGLGIPALRYIYLLPYRSRLTDAVRRARHAYVRLRARERHLNLVLTAYPPAINRAFRRRRAVRPFIVRPAPVETMSPSEVKIGPAPEHKPVPRKPIEITVQLLQNQDNPVVQDLMKTSMGRAALKTEQLYGGKLSITDGTGSFYDPRTNAISIGLGKDFAQGQRFAQKRLIHEQTHRAYAKTGRTADPRHFTRPEEYVKSMLLEEAEAEGNAIHHIMELNPNGPFIGADAIYVQAYRKGYQDLKMMMLWATDKQLAAEGHKRGKEALFQAFKSGELTPSVSKEGEYETYTEYYEKLWLSDVKPLTTYGKP